MNIERWITRQTTRQLKKGKQIGEVYTTTTEVQQVEEGATVRLTFDVEEIIRKLGEEAMRSRNGRATALDGRILVVVVDGTRQQKARKAPERTWNAPPAGEGETVVAAAIPQDDVWHTV